jgi:hypothetical protein
MSSPMPTARHVISVLAFFGASIALGIAGWRVCGRFGERCEDVGHFFPRYNANTRQIDLVMYDVNRNGVIDTWVYRKGEDESRVDIDSDEDGAIDRTLIFDRHSTLRFNQTGGKERGGP